MKAEQFIVACEQGDTEQVKRFIGKVDIESCNDHGNTALFIASRYGHKDIAQLLINNGADPMAQNNSGITPLFASIHGDNVDIALLLIDQGIDINYRNKGGCTAFYIATFLSKKAIFNLLIGESLFASACFGRPSPIKPQITRRFMFQRLRPSCSNIVQSTTGWIEHRSNDSTRSRRYLHFHSASCVKTQALSLSGCLKNLHSAQKLRFQDFSALVKDVILILGIIKMKLH